MVARQLPHVLGIPWYTAESYAACLALFEDAAKLPAVYEDWIARAKAREQAEVAAGHRVIRIVVEPVEFSRWCAEHGYAHINADARGNFAAIRAGEIVLSHGGASKP
jgi:hypothetical protein